MAPLSPLCSIPNVQYDAELMYELSCCSASKDITVMFFKAVSMFFLFFFKQYFSKDNQVKIRLKRVLILNVIIIYNILLFTFFLYRCFFTIQQRGIIRRDMELVHCGTQIRITLAGSGSAMKTGSGSDFRMLFRKVLPKCLIK